MLFHVTANSDWSNLPLSGLFVDMLRRVATLGKAGGVSLAGEPPATDCGASDRGHGRRAAAAAERSTGSAC